MVLDYLNVRLCHAITFPTYRPIHFLKEKEMSFSALFNSILKRKVGQNTDMIFFKRKRMMNRNIALPMIGENRGGRGQKWWYPYLVRMTTDNEKPYT